MKNMGKIFRRILFAAIVLTAVLAVPGKEVKASSTYYSVVNYCNNGKLFAEKAGNYYIWADNNYNTGTGSLKIGTKAGTAKITKTYKGATVSTGMVTNGSVIFYAAGDNLYKIGVNGKGYKKVKTIKNLTDVCGAYGGKVYFTKTIYAASGMYSDERLYSLTLSTGKVSSALVKQFRFQSSYGTNISGRQFTMAVDVQPIKVYNVKSGKCTKPVKATDTCIYGSKLYYFPCTYSDGAYKGNLKCYDLKTGKKTTVLKSLPPLTEMGRKTAMFIDYTSTNKAVYSKLYYSTGKMVTL